MVGVIVLKTMRQSHPASPSYPPPPAHALATEDPLTGLPPVARNILAATRRILESDGYEALTLQRIASEAGEAKGSIAYYFGNKAGLVATLVDSLVHDANRALISQTERWDGGERRVHALIDGETRISADLRSFRTFFELLPHVLREDDLRPRVARLYDGYRDTVLRCLGAHDEEQRRRLLPHAMLMIAIVDGLAIQHGLDAGGIDISAATGLWERLLRRELDE